jgi:hypothetical protein
MAWQATENRQDVGRGGGDINGGAKRAASNIWQRRKSVTSCRRSRQRKLAWRTSRACASAATRAAPLRA